MAELNADLSEWIEKYTEVSKEGIPSMHVGTDCDIYKDPVPGRPDEDHIESRETKDSSKRRENRKRAEVEVQTTGELTVKMRNKFYCHENKM